MIQLVIILSLVAFGNDGINDQTYSEQSINGYLILMLEKFDLLQ